MVQYRNNLRWPVRFVWLDRYGRTLVGANAEIGGSGVGLVGFTGFVGRMGFSGLDGLLGVIDGWTSSERNFN